MAIKDSGEKATKGWVCLAKTTTPEEVGVVLQQRLQEATISELFKRLEYLAPKDASIHFKVKKSGMWFRVEEYR